MGRAYWISSGILGATGVLFGAFGAHGLDGHLAPLPDASVRFDWWETAAHYHLIHALALAIAAYLLDRTELGSARAAGYCFATGVCLFSGSLYAMALTGLRGLGAVTPIGGLLLVTGWALVAWTAWRS